MTTSFARKALLGTAIAVDQAIGEVRAGIAFAGG